MSGCCYARCCLSPIRGSVSFPRMLQHAESWSLGSNHSPRYQLSNSFLVAVHFNYTMWTPRVESGENHYYHRTSQSIWWRKLNSSDTSTKCQLSTVHGNGSFTWKTKPLWRPIGGFSVTGLQCCVTVETRKVWGTAVAAKPIKGDLGWSRIISAFLTS